ncbi:outer membrane protein assembly factor BamB family protein [Microscilla marina]|uniref:Pyrrolo-quinoline quinone repeat domain-containing protein n=1 Tax=Microscilla marina ATCC 23134 TaxID=313606 RepID=A1ZKK1_MICM2|nr:PQQ-binding-like beta-propeller repeat protein [Microscilla marina]EAY29227.1 hypothetical protein M23134_02418 [Microscilla marina ATCC 23134]
MLGQILLHWFDFFYDLPIIVYIALLVGWVFFLQYLVRFIKQNWIGVLVVLLGVAVPLFLILIKSWWGLGYLHEQGVTYVGVSGKYLALSDHYATYSKGGKRADHRRLYLVNTQTGEVLFRSSIKGKVTNLTWEDDKLLMQAGTNSRFFSLKGTSKKAFKKPNLKNLPELKSGIYKQGYNASTDQVWVINKKGEKFFYNAQTLQREPKNTLKVKKTTQTLKAFQPIKNLFKTKYGAVKNKKYYDRRAYCPVSFFGNRRSNIRKRLYIARQPINKYFVYGRLRYCLPAQNFALISSYQTTDKKKTVLTAINTNTGETLWEQTPAQLAGAKNKAKVYYFIPVEGNESVVLVGEYLLRLQTNTGKVIWKTRL